MRRPPSRSISYIIMGESRNPLFLFPVSPRLRPLWTTYCSAYVAATSPRTSQKIDLWSEGPKVTRLRAWENAKECSPRAACLSWRKPATTLLQLVAMTDWSCQLVWASLRPWARSCRDRRSKMQVCRVCRTGVCMYVWWEELLILSVKASVQNVPQKRGAKPPQPARALFKRSERMPACSWIADGCCNDRLCLTAGVIAE